MDAERAVHDLGDPQVDDDAGERERVVRVEPELALHQVEHAVDGDPRGAVRGARGSRRSASASAVRATGHSSCRSSRTSSVSCASAGHSIAVPGDLAVALRRVAVAG